MHKRNKHKISSVPTQHFNTLLFDQAISIIDNNPYLAAELLKEYISQFPSDYTAYPYYAYVLITTKNLDEAERILNLVSEIAFEDQKFINDEKKVKYLRDHILSNLLRLYSYQENYGKLYYLLRKYKDNIMGVNMNHIYFYCKSKTGKLVDSNRDEYGYLHRQIYQYDEEDFYKHIEKHLYEFQNSDDVNSNVFVEGFPIREVIEEIKKYIPSEKSLYPGFYDDSYIFKYDGCGHENGKIVDFIKIVCFHGTSDFITIVPVKDFGNLPYVDLNYLVNKDTYTRTRRKNQVDKFNDRFNKAKKLT